MPFVKGLIPQKGDLLRVRRKLGYCHFGLALGPDAVIHFSGGDNDSITNPGEVKIRRSPMSVFKKEDEIEVMSPYDSPFTRNEVLSRAKEFMDSPTFRSKPYDFLMNNCEHFARYAYYDQPESGQVNDGLAFIAASVTMVNEALGKKKK